MPATTSLITRYGIRVPLVLAPMAGASGGLLAGTVSKAGGLGFVAWTPGPAAPLATQLALARQTAGSSTTPLGVGLLCWALDARGQEGQDALDVVVAAEDVRAVWLFAGEWKRFVREIRRREEKRGTEKGKKKDIWLQVGTMEQAREALESREVDVLVVQGSEAGGHGLIASRPLDTLLPKVVQLAATSSTPVPVIGAGGLMTGADLAHVLSLGAAGGVMGTRFLTTREATYPEAKKQAVAQAGLQQEEQGKDEQPATGRSVAWDRAGNVPWPEGYDGRALINRTASDYAALSSNGNGQDELANLRARFKQAVTEGNLDQSVVWAGVGAGRVREIQGAEEVVREVEEGFEEALGRA